MAPSSQGFFWHLSVAMRDRGWERAFSSAAILDIVTRSLCDSSSTPCSLDCPNMDTMQSRKCTGTVCGLEVGIRQSVVWGMREHRNMMSWWWDKINYLWLFGQVSVMSHSHHPLLLSVSLSFSLPVFLSLSLKLEISLEIIMNGKTIWNTINVIMSQLCILK